MTTLYRCRKGGWFGDKAIMQKLDESDGAEWRDVRFSLSIGLFTAVRLRYWQAIEAKLAQNAAAAEARRAQRAAKKTPPQRDFEASKFSDTRMPT